MITCHPKKIPKFLLNGGVVQFSLMSTNFFLSVVLTECSQQFPASEVGLTELCQNMEEQNLFVPEYVFI